MTPFLILGFLAGGTPDADAAAALALARAARDRHPVVKVAKPVRVTNGFNCGASFCSAQGGPGCAATGRNCPNGVGGVCVCGAKARASLEAGPGQISGKNTDSWAGSSLNPSRGSQAPPTFGYLLPGTAYQSCPGGNCPTGR